jgi:hypothetical protein
LNYTLFGFGLKIRYDIDMKIVKLILGIVAVFFAVWLGFAVVGLLYSLLFYAVIVGVLGVAGFAGYKMLTAKDTPELNSYDGISQFEMDDLKSVKQLEEMKRKYLK